MNKILCFILFCCISYAGDHFQWQDEGTNNNFKLKKNNNLLPSIKKQTNQNLPNVPFPNSLIEDSFFSDLDDMHDLHKKVQSMQNDMFNQMHQLMGSNSIINSMPLSTNNFFQNTKVKFVNKSDYLIVQVPVQSSNMNDFTLSLNHNQLQIKQSTKKTVSKTQKNSSLSSTSFSSSMRSISLPIVPKAISNQMIAQGKLIVTLKK